MSRRRTGAIAIGVSAATAVVLSLVGAKTPVVIGSAAAIGVAGGVVAWRKGAGKRVSTTKQLVGEELLAKVKELGDVSKSDLVRACGYVSTKKGGGERLNFTAFYEALLKAKSHWYESLSEGKGIAKEEEDYSQDDKENFSDLPPLRNAFWVSLEIITREYKYRDDSEMTIATYKTLCNIEDWFNPEITDRGEDADEVYWSIIIEDKDYLSEIDLLKEWTKGKLEDDEDCDELSQYWKIGADESSTYSDKESFISAVDWDMVIKIVKEAWDFCRSEKAIEKIIEREKEIDSIEVEDFAGHSEENDSEKEIQNYTEAITNDPSNPDNYVGRANQYDSLGEYEKAIKDYDKALQIKEEAKTYFYRGASKFRQQITPEKELTNPSVILDDYNKSIELDPNNFHAYKFRGELRHFYLNDDKGAIDDFKKVLELNPDEKLISYVSLANLLDDAGNYDEAISLYGEVLLKDSDFYPAYYHRGFAKSIHGDFEGAILDFNKTLELDPYKDPEESDVYRERGKAKKELGDLKGACEDWKKAAELGDKDAAVLIKEHCQ